MFLIKSLNLLALLLVGLAAHALEVQSFRTLEKSEHRFLSSYVVPNEKAYETFAVENEGKTGVLLSVGTFRSFVSASYGEFDDLVLLDVDSNVVAFNLRQVEALKKSTNVAQFLANLVELPQIEKDIAEVLLRKDMRLVQRIEDRWLSAGTDANSYVERLLRLSIREKRGFMTEPHAYAKLRALARAGRIHCLQGDLTGKGVMPALAQTLKSAGQKISVLDISNTIDYIIANGKLGALVKNLVLLPRTRDAIVNLTTSAAPPEHRQSGDIFLYGVLRADNFLRDARSGQFKDIDRFANYLYYASGDCEKALRWRE